MKRPPHKHVMALDGEVESQSLDLVAIVNFRSYQPPDTKLTIAG